MNTDKAHFYDEAVETAVVSIIEDEYVVSKRNRDSANLDFEAAIDMLECERTEKDYVWQSDVFYPEFPSHVITEASVWADQLFKSREYVDVYLEDESDPYIIQKAECVRRCINKTLNNRAIFHFHKYMRGRMINTLRGEVYLVCKWDRATRREIVGMAEETIELDVDTQGYPMVDSERQTPETTTVQRPVEADVLVYDRFNYDIVDPRNVFTDNTYTYSIQEKPWVIIRSEMSLAQLFELKEANGYINLDILADKLSHKKRNSGPTDTARDSFNQENQEEPAILPSIKLDILERYGYTWCVIDQRAPDGYPIQISPGYTDNKERKKGAELVKCICTYAQKDNTKVLIRYQPVATRRPDGEPYIPIIRGLCYIHPTKDTGLSDGKYLRELQVSINDTGNLANDRTKLATLPTLVGNRLALKNNDTVFIEPEHVIEVNNPKEDLQELKFTDNIEGALAMINMNKQAMHEIMAIWPTTMGGMPAAASTTATAVAGAESRTDVRTGFKSLVFEHTMLVDFYTMIIHMIYQFASPETAQKMMGDHMQFFDPNAVYSYKPVTSAIESEFNKQNKIKMWDQVLGRLVGLPPTPSSLMMLNYIIAEICKLMGNEFEQFADYLLNPNEASMMQQGGGPQAPETAGASASNQYGNAPSAAENAVRQ